MTTKEQTAVGAFLGAMHDQGLDGAKVREAMLEVLGVTSSNAVGEPKGLFVDLIASHGPEFVAEMAAIEPQAPVSEEGNRALKGLMLEVWACTKPNAGATTEQMRATLSRVLPHIRGLALVAPKQVEPVADPLPAVRSAKEAFESTVRTGMTYEYESYVAGYEQGQYDESMYQGPPDALEHIEVTDDMHRAAVKVLHRAPGLDGLPQRMMDAMLAAAPKQPTNKVQE